MRNARYFQDQQVLIDNLQLHRNSDGTAQVIVHGQVEKDRINSLVNGLENLLGVMEVGVMK